MENRFSNLSEEDKGLFNLIFNQMFGDTDVRCETGEPMLMDKDGKLIQTTDAVMHRLEMVNFHATKNPPF